MTENVGGLSPREGGGGCKRCVRIEGPGPGTGLLFLRFYLTCDQVCAVIQVINKGFCVRGGGQYL